MVDERFYVIQGSNFFVNDYLLHIVRKGIFMADDQNQMEDILLTFCGLFTYDDEPDVPGTFDEEWKEQWFENGGCEDCYRHYEMELSV